jgi:hypothetical protein
MPSEPARRPGQYYADAGDELAAIHCFSPGYIGRLVALALSVFSLCALVGANCGPTESS